MRKDLLLTTDEVARTVVIDLDGVIAENRKCWWQYGKCKVVKGAGKAIDELRKMGFVVIIDTARLEKDRRITEKWLKDNKIKVDEIYFGKPRGIVYLDDKGIKFNGWGRFLNDLKELIEEEGN